MLSVTFVLVGRWLLLGVSAKAIMSITGTRRPMREYSYGLLEFRQARHHTIAKITAIIMISVPIPIPKMRVGLVVCALADYAKKIKFAMISLPIML